VARRRPTEAEYLLDVPDLWDRNPAIRQLNLLTPLLIGTSSPTAGVLATMLSPRRRMARMPSCATATASPGTPNRACSAVTNARSSSTSTLSRLSPSYLHGAAGLDKRPCRPTQVKRPPLLPGHKAVSPAHTFTACGRPTRPGCSPAAPTSSSFKNRLAPTPVSKRWRPTARSGTPRSRTETRREDPQPSARAHTENLAVPRTRRSSFRTRSPSISDSDPGLLAQPPGTCVDTVSYLLKD
jgi:hypothetical protein